MLIWGSSSMQIKHRELIEGVCTVCGHKEFILHGIQCYGHLWWIPFFPTRKEFFLTCLQCESTISNSKAGNLIQDIDESTFKTPFWSYIGVFIVICLIPLGIFTAVNETNNPDQPKNYETKYAWDSVKTNDFLILHDKENFGYLLAHILKMDNEKITFQFSKFLYKRKSELVSIAHVEKQVFDDTFYQSDYYETTFEMLKKEFQLEEVVSRKDSPSDNSKTGADEA